VRSSQFGHSDGNTIAIGAPGYGGDDFLKFGRVIVLRYNGTIWEQLGQNIDGGDSHSQRFYQHLNIYLEIWYYPLQRQIK